jgi:hypothetical protein
MIKRIIIGLGVFAMGMVLLWVLLTSIPKKQTRVAKVCVDGLVQLLDSTETMYLHTSVKCTPIK